jgi:hypothetical protein
VKDQLSHTIDDLIAEIRGMSIEEIANEPWDGPHLISVDELRAAGALDVPAAWRKSLGVERDRLPGLFDEDDPPSDEHEPAPSDLDEDVSANQR